MQSCPKESSETCNQHRPTPFPSGRDGIVLGEKRQSTGWPCCLTVAIESRALTAMALQALHSSSMADVDPMRAKRATTSVTRHFTETTAILVERVVSFSRESFATKDGWRTNRRAREPVRGLESKGRMPRRHSDGPLVGGAWYGTPRGRVEDDDTAEMEVPRAIGWTSTSATRMTCENGADWLDGFGIGPIACSILDKGKHP